MRHLARFCCLLLVWRGVALGAGMVVGPARIELRLAEGESQMTTISINNPENVSRVFRLRVMPFTLTDTGDLAIGEESKSADLKWIEINPEEVEIGPQQTGEVRVRLTPPPGGHGTVWAGVLVTIPPTAKAQGGFGIMTEPRVFVPIYITVKGTEQARAEITDFQAVRDSAGVFHFRASLQNTGNTLIRPAGSWVLEENTASGPIELLVVPFSGEPVLPGQKRKFEGEGRGKVPSEKLTASVFFDYGQKRGEIVSQSGPVSAVDVGPKRETRSPATGVMVASSERSRSGSAAKPFRISFVKEGILLDAGETIQCRSELKESPPALILELVGYRSSGPHSYRGSRLVDSVTVEEIQSKPVISRLEVHFKVPVEAKVVEEPTGLLVALSPKTASPAAASSRTRAAEPSGATSIPPEASPTATPPASARDSSNATRRFLVQVGAFAESANVHALKTRLTASGFATIEQSGQRRGSPLVTLLVGPYPDRASAEAARGKLREIGVSDGVLRRLPSAP